VQTDGVMAMDSARHYRFGYWLTITQSLWTTLTTHVFLSSQTKELRSLFFFFQLFRNTISADKWQRKDI